METFLVLASSIDWVSLVTTLLSAGYVISHALAAFGKKELSEDLEIKVGKVEKFVNIITANYGAHTSAKHVYRKTEEEKPLQE